MAMGCPVLSSNVTSLPEVCGDAALYVNPHKIEEIIENTKKITLDDSLNNSLKEKSIERVKIFSDEAYQTRLSKIINTI